MFTWMFSLNILKFISHLFTITHIDGTVKCTILLEKNHDDKKHIVWNSLETYSNHIDVIYYRPKTNQVIYRHKKLKDTLGDKSARKTIAYC